MKIRFPLFLLCFVVLTFFSLESCKKPVIFSKGNLSFSVDTLIFDTVFTTIGSTTQQFKIYNNENKSIEIEEIELVGGSNSPFRMNVDGISGISMQSIELGGDDSLFVFVEVTLQANGQNNPMVVEDSIRFRTNGKDQYVKLAVWGQDAYFHYQDLNEGVWLSDKPHVVYDRAYVLEDKSLIINAGAKIHFHKNSILFVKKGQLLVNGTKGNEIVFQGDRLEAMYEDVSGQWYGIYLDSCMPSQINYAIIKNGTSGIHITGNNPENAPTAYSLEVSNTQILNHASYGIFLFAGAKLKMENSISARNGRHALLALQGGDFNINHCNLLSYAESDEEQIAVAVKNYYTQDGITYVGEVNEGKIYNSVMYGYQEYEFVLDTLNPDNVVTLNFDIRNCVIRSDSPSSASMFSQIFWNQNPDFSDIGLNDFHVTTSSILNGNANPAFSLPFDLDGTPRSLTAPDIGAYEAN